MEQFVGLDISQAMTHLCVVDGKGKKLWQGKCPTKPEEIAKTIRDKAPSATLIGMESGSLSPWLWHALKAMGLPVVCIDARHAHSALSMQINKTDANDAHGIAQMMRTSFFKEVTVKSLDSHRIRTLLGARAQLVGMRTDLKNQVRGVLKTFGFMVSQSVEKGFEAKVRGTIVDQPLLQKMVNPLMEVLQTVQEQVQRSWINCFEEYAENDKICRHLMTIPGVGVVTAVAFTAAVDDPKRFKKSRSVGAYFGLTNRRYQSGEREITPDASPSAATGWCAATCTRQPACTPDANQIMVGPQVLGTSDRQAERHEQGQESPWPASWRSSCIRCGSPAKRFAGPNLKRPQPKRTRRNITRIRRLTDASLAGTKAPVIPPIGLQLQSMRLRPDMGNRSI